MKTENSLPNEFDCKSVLVTGGAKSGKSRFAENLLLKSDKSLIYLATATAFDDEMRKRIKQHQSHRNQRWSTIEESISIVEVIKENAKRDTAILVDCITLWLTTLMVKEMDIEGETERLVELIPTLPGVIVIVTNELGTGLVPEVKMARQFRDYAGSLNQKLASVCDAAYLVVAAQPILLKPVLQPEISL